jgi:hypothetical protein
LVAGRGIYGSYSQPTGYHIDLTAPYGRFGVLQRDRYIDPSDQALKELSA